VGGGNGGPRMSPFARIAALHRELAEAYERLAEGDMPKARRKPPAPKPDVSASPAAIAAVRRRLRKQGVAA
jgi:hypothetical protein